MVGIPLFEQVIIEDGDPATIALVAPDSDTGNDLFQKLLQLPDFRIERDAVSNNYIFSITYPRSGKTFSAKKLYSNSEEDKTEEAILLRRPRFVICAAYQNQNRTVTYINTTPITNIKLLY